jgi:hypothetical protein
MSFSLRIDSSRLEFSCQPDVNVLAGLNWDSGGFVVEIAPDAQGVTLTGSVAGLTCNIKHGFLSEECASVKARNLAFTIGILRAQGKTGDQHSAVSVVVDTELFGGVRFSRLQDLLCFKAVWIDRLPVLNGQASPVKVGSKPLPEPPAEKGFLNTIVLLRSNRIELDVDLGQSISTLHLEISPLISTTRMSTESTELSIEAQNLHVEGKGSIAGHLRLPNIQFRTKRRGNEATMRAAMLEMLLKTGPLDVAFESDHQMLLQYRLVVHL